MEDRTRFTTEQVLRGMQTYAQIYVDPALRLDPDAPLISYRESASGAGECALTVLAELADYIGLSLSETRVAVFLRLPRRFHRNPYDIPRRDGERRHTEWEEWEQNIAPTITLRHLAAYLARRSRGISMEPVAVFGMPCAAAGVFYGLRKLPEVRRQRIAPSTPLRDAIPPTRFNSFWRRVAWISGATLEEPQELAKLINFHSVGEAIATLVFWSIAVGSFLLSMCAIRISADLPSLAQAAAGIAALPAMLALFLAPFVARDAVLDKLADPVPKGFHTFGDLAKIVASGRTN